MSNEIKEKVKKYTLTKALIKLFKDDLQDFTSNPEKKVNISKLLKQARIKSGQSLEDLAGKIGTDPLTLKEVEDCDCEATFEELPITLEELSITI